MKQVAIPLYIVDYIEHCYQLKKLLMHDSKKCRSVILLNLFQIIDILTTYRSSINSNKGIMLAKLPSLYNYQNKKNFMPFVSITTTFLLEEIKLMIYDILALEDFLEAIKEKDEISVWFHQTTKSCQQFQKVKQYAE
ncbi:unnamed protein product [Thelazia callipaeda]|uniref:Uncharacterized protein n=1 Tax=Thelazia callipaeda TaxID=103827 RepID=A0A0N5CP48_THECL|nr:unnamed protein product [Thelazia callipaeda]